MKPIVILMVCLMACQGKKPQGKEAVRAEAPKKLLSKHLNENYEAALKMAQVYQKAGDLEKAKEYFTNSQRYLQQADSLLKSPNPNATIP
jgi:Tfp pilus assembly protein PilF